MTSKQLSYNLRRSGTSVGPVSHEMITRAKAMYFSACVLVGDWEPDEAGWEDFIPEARKETEKNND